MTVGETYWLKVAVRNTGNVSANYAVVVMENSSTGWADHFYFPKYVDKFYLKPGESRSTKFGVVPILPNVGATPIVAELYHENEQSEFVDVDSAWSYVSEIRRGFPIEVVLPVVVIVLVALVFVKLRPRREISTLIALFLISILLHGLILPNIEVYIDEVSMQRWGFQILAEEWHWPEWLMWMYPPLEPYISAVTTIFFGRQLEVHRWIWAFFGALTICGVYLLGKAVFDRRTGLLSAMLLAFCPYYLYWTCLVRGEAPTILLILASCYFFWKGFQHPNKPMNMFMAGIFFGLGFDMMYVTLALPLVFLAFFLWFRGRVRAVSKNDLVIFASASLLVAMPVLAALYIDGANPFWWQFVGRFEAQRKLEVPFASIADLAVRGLQNLVGLFVWRGEILWWFPIFWAASLTILLVVCVYYGYFLLLRKRPSEGFVTMLFGAFVLFVVFYQAREQHLLLYSFPFLIIMISNLVVRAVDGLRGRAFSLGSHIIPFISLVLTGVLVFSSLCIVVMQPTVEKGQVVGLSEAMSYLRRQAQPGDRVATLYGIYEARYAEQYHLELDLLFIPLLSTETPGEPNKPRTSPWVLDTGRLEIFQPRFMVIQRQHYDFYFNQTFKQEMSRFYKLVLDTGPEMIGGLTWRGYLVFQRFQPVAFEG